MKGLVSTFPPPSGAEKKIKIGIKNPFTHSSWLLLRYCSLNLVMLASFSYELTMFHLVTLCTKRNQTHVPLSTALTHFYQSSLRNPRKNGDELARADTEVNFSSISALLISGHLKRSKSI